MKRMFITAATICLLCTMMPSCGKADKEKQPDSLMEASRQELATALAERDQLLTLMREITQSMDRIRQLENVMALTGTQPNENPVQRSRILAEIAALQRTLKQRREQLTELESRLEKSSLYTDELRATVGTMRRQIDSQSKEIAALRGQLTKANEQIDSLANQVDSLNSSMAAVNEELDSAQATSLRLENELNTCYYVAATKQELKRHKIIETGFLRKSKLMKGDFDSGFFSVDDKRNLSTIRLSANKAKLLTNHPEGSYEMADSGKNITIRIVNPEKFWSLTNYLVIETD